MLEGPAQVALQQPGEAALGGPQADPHRVLLEKRLVEAVLLAQEIDLLERRLVALALQLGDLVGQKIARRQLDDGEGDEADHEQRRDHDQHAMDRVPEHGYLNQNVSGL